MRQCAGAGDEKQERNDAGLKTPENEILLDTTGRKNGRGAYLCVSMECLNKAVKNHGIERSLKTEIPQEVYEDLKKEFEKLEKQQ